MGRSTGYWRGVLGRHRHGNASLERISERREWPTRRKDACRCRFTSIALDPGRSVDQPRNGGRRLGDRRGLGPACTDGRGGGGVTWTRRGGAGARGAATTAKALATLFRETPSAGLGRCRPTMIKRDDDEHGGSCRQVLPPTRRPWHDRRDRPRGEPTRLDAVDLRREDVAEHVGGRKSLSRFVGERPAEDRIEVRKAAQAGQRVRGRFSRTREDARRRSSRRPRRTRACPSAPRTRSPRARIDPREVRTDPRRATRARSTPA